MFIYVKKLYIIYVIEKRGILNLSVVNDFNNKNDRELVKIANTSNNLKERNIALTVLLQRYESQIHKNWHVLEKQMNYSTLVEAMKDEYYGEAAIAVLKAIQKVDLSKIKNDKWKLVGMTDWYLRNVRTKIINNIKKDAKIKPLNYMHELAEDESFSADPDVEEAYWEDGGYKTDPSYVVEMRDTEERCQKIIEECKQKWSTTERVIFNGLLNHKSKADIAREVGCNVSKVYAAVKSMKGELSRKFLV